MAAAAELDVGKTFIFLDLESTGLFTKATQEPPPRITEIAMVAITKAEFVRHISAANHEPRQIVNLPRISKVIQLQVDPECDVTEKAAEISGLTTELLRGQKTLSKIWPRLSDFVEDQPQPVTFIAHNGSKFDFRLLKSEIDRLQLSNILQGRFTVDSLNLFKSLDHGYAAEFAREIAADKVVNNSVPHSATNVMNGAAILTMDHGRFNADPPPLHENVTSPAPPSVKRRLFNDCVPVGKVHSSPGGDSNTSANGTTPHPNPVLTRRHVDMTDWNVAKRALFHWTAWLTVGWPSYKLKTMWKNVIGTIDVDPPFPEPRWHTALDDTLALVQVSLAHGQKFVDAVQAAERLQNH